jgi:hypothetical protein
VSLLIGLSLVALEHDAPGLQVTDGPRGVTVPVPLPAMPFKFGGLGLGLGATTRSHWQMRLKSESAVGPGHPPGPCQSEPQARRRVLTELAGQGPDSDGAASGMATAT